MADDFDEQARPEKRKGKYADRPYPVGKGKPPQEHQFKRGNTSGGRKPGSRNKSRYHKLLNERIRIGEDSLGRAIRKPWGDVIDRQLLKLAAKGDLTAIRIVKDFELKLTALERSFDSSPPSSAEIARMAAKEQERRALSAKIIGFLEEAAQRKREGSETRPDDQSLSGPANDAGPEDGSADESGGSEDQP